MTNVKIAILFLLGLTSIMGCGKRSFDITTPKAQVSYGYNQSQSGYPDSTAVYLGGSAAPGWTPQDPNKLYLLGYVRNGQIRQEISREMTENWIGVDASAFYQVNGVKERSLNGLVIQGQPMTEYDQSLFDVLAHAEVIKRSGIGEVQPMRNDRSRLRTHTVRIPGSPDSVVSIRCTWSRFDHPLPCTYDGSAWRRDIKALDGDDFLIRAENAQREINEVYIDDYRSSVQLNLANDGTQYNAYHVQVDANGVPADPAPATLAQLVPSNSPDRKWLTAIQHRRIAR